LPVGSFLFNPSLDSDDSEEVIWDVDGCAGAACPVLNGVLDGAGSIGVVGDDDGCAGAACPVLNGVLDGAGSISVVGDDDGCAGPACPALKDVLDGAESVDMVDGDTDRNGAESPSVGELSREVVDGAALVETKKFPNILPTPRGMLTAADFTVASFFEQAPRWARSLPLPHVGTSSGTGCLGRWFGLEHLSQCQ
jgi:hypothetical protein